MPGENSVSADSIPSINEGFMQGGDKTLRSKDGIDFSVHSLFLSVASPIFSELLQTGNTNEIIRLSEDAEVLALMLKFIYPAPTPKVSTVALLNDGLRVAEKYQLENMKSRLREQLVLVDSPVSIQSNPFGALYIASTHGFVTEAELAAKIVSKQANFDKEDDLRAILDAAPHSSTVALVKLTGMPLVKTRVLTEVLFHFERSPMAIHHNTDLIRTFLCVHCQGIYIGSKRQSPPEWQARWAHWIFEEIKDRPIVEWKDYFKHSNFNRSFYQPHLPASFRSYEFFDTRPTCECAGKITRAAAKFQPWADGVYEHLKSQLSYVMELEAQIHNLGPNAKSS